jgi:hypothetical protein
VRVRSTHSAGCRGRGQHDPVSVVADRLHRAVGLVGMHYLVDAPTAQGRRDDAFHLRDAPRDHAVPRSRFAADAIPFPVPPSSRISGSREYRGRTGPVEQRRETR